MQSAVAEQVVASIGPSTVTVLGSHWKDSGPWAGFDFARAEVRNGSIWSPSDYHLSVPWMHPTDRAAGRANNPDCWAIYRLRLKRGWNRFVKIDGKWMASKEPADV